MPVKIHYTKEQLRYIEEQTAMNTSYDVIAAHIGVNRNAIIEIARKFPQAREKRRQLREEAYARTTNDRDMHPLPAGHAVSWRTITKGTCLEGMPYDGIPRNDSVAAHYSR